MSISQSESEPKLERTHEGLLEIWDAFTPDQLAPSEGTLLSVGTAAELLTKEQLETLRNETSMFNEARMVAGSRIGRIPTRNQRYMGF